MRSSLTPLCSIKLVSKHFCCEIFSPANSHWMPACAYLSREARQMQWCSNQTKLLWFFIYYTCETSVSFTPVSPLTTEICLILFHWNHTFSPFNTPVTISELSRFKKMVLIGAMSVLVGSVMPLEVATWGQNIKRREFILDSMVDWIIALWRCPHPNSQKLWFWGMQIN